jgi:hypothetical protein
MDPSGEADKSQQAVMEVRTLIDQILKMHLTLRISSERIG